MRNPHRGSWIVLPEKWRCLRYPLKKEPGLKREIVWFLQKNIG
jgi:hypothetical protein